VSDSQYDEPGSRTRQAWLRTALGMVAVTALVERGLVVDALPAAMGILAVIPAVVLVGLAVRRSAALGPQESAGLGRVAVAVACLAVTGLSVAAVMAVLGGSS
jgi:hypothetical protein